MKIQNGANRLFLLLSLTLCVACTKPEPNRATLLKTVETMQASLAKQDVDTALSVMMAPEGVPVEKLKKELLKVNESENLSVAGVKLFVAKAKFGKLAALFPKDAARRAGRFKLPIDECYALKLKCAEVMAHWKDGKFRIFRFDDLGSKLVEGPCSD